MKKGADWTGEPHPKLWKLGASWGDIENDVPPRWPGDWGIVVVWGGGGIKGMGVNGGGGARVGAMVGGGVLWGRPTPIVEVTNRGGGGL